MRRSAPPGALLLAAMLAATSCASMLRPPRAGSGPPPGPVADDRYRAVLDRFTRRAELFNKLDASVFVAATMQTMAFREARVGQVASFRSLGTAESEALLAAERKEHEESIDFFMGLYAGEHRFDDLARPTSIWTVQLASESGEAVASKIERVVRPDVNLTTLYPFLEPFWTGYRVHFPRTFPNGAQVIPAGARKVTLRLSSAVGKVELAYDLEPGPAGAPWP